MFKKILPLLLTLALFLPANVFAGSAFRAGGVSVSANPDTGWLSNLTFTPSAAFGTVTSPSYWYRRVGDSMEVRLTFTAGTVAASVASIQLPSGYTIDTAKFSSAANTQLVGVGVSTGSASTAIFGGNYATVVFYDGSTSDRVFISSNTTSNQLTKQNGSSIFNSSAPLSFNFTVPISGWRTGSTQQATINIGGAFYGSVKYAGTSNCTWSRNSATFGSYSADSDCPTPTATDSAQVPATKIPAIKITGQIGEKWVFKATSRFQEESGADFCSWRFSNGTDTSEPQVNQGADSTPSIEASLTLTVAGEQTVEIQAANSAAGGNCNVDAQYAGKSNLLIEAFKFPRSSSQTVDIFAQGDYGPTPYTPTFTGFGTATGVECTHARQGKWMDIACKFTSGTPTATQGRISLPGSFTIDSGVYPTVARVGGCGFSSTSSFVCHVQGTGGNSYVAIGGASIGAGVAALSSSNADALVGSGTAISFSARVPITGWSTFPFGVGGGAPVTARVSGNPGAVSTGAVVNFPTEDYDPQNMYSAGTFTFPAGKTFCQLRYYITGDGTNMKGTCFKNGSQQNIASDNDTSGPGVQNGTCYFDGVAGDTFGMRPTNTAMTGNAADNAHAVCF